MTKAQETRKARIEAAQAEAATLRAVIESTDYTKHGANATYVRNANLSALALLESKVKRLQDTFAKHETGSHLTVHQKVAAALAAHPDGWEVGWFNHGRTGRTYMPCAKDLQASDVYEALRKISKDLERYILHTSLLEVIIRRGANV